MPSILFVCSNNSCSSLFAESICRKRAPGSWVIASAGVKPAAQIDPKAKELLRRNGLDAPSSAPKGLDAVPAKTWDYIVMLGCSEIPPLANGAKLIHWPITEHEDGAPQLHEDIYGDLTQRIDGLIRFIRELAMPA